MHKSSNSRRSFWALIITQFFGALNDNLFKILVSLFVVKTYLSQEQSVLQLMFINIFFVLPYLLFSPYAGYLADRYSKSQIIRLTKLLEVVVTLFGGFYLLQGNSTALLIVLFFMGLHSTLFSPAKYGIMPEILEEEELSRGNGYLEMWTFCAIIAGSALAGLILEVAGGSFYLPSVCIVAVAVLGLISSFFVAKVNATSPNKKRTLNPLHSFFVLSEIKKFKNLYLVIWGIAFFIGIGALYQLNIILFAKRSLALGDGATAAMLGVLGVGIGLGSIFAGRVSGGKVELGLVPLGALAIAISSLFLALMPNSFYLSLVYLLILGFGSGIYIVPFNAFLQAKSPEKLKGEYIAASNALSFAAMLLASVFLWLAIDICGFNPKGIFLIGGLVTLLVTYVIFNQMPQLFLRCLNWLLTHTLYSLKVYGKENIPSKGGALIVCNHVSFVDASLLWASIERPIRFLMYRSIYELPFIHFIVKRAGVIPIAAGDSPRETLRSLKAAREAIQNGELVCIFAEGGITRIGRLLGFQRGLEKIAKGLDAPIIPAYIDRMWGSIFSFKDGKFFWKRPREIPHPASVSYGKALPSSTATSQVRDAVQEIASVAFAKRSPDNQLLHSLFIKEVKRSPNKIAISDSSGKELSYRETLIAALSLSRLIKKLYAKQSMLGIYLPPSIGAVLANLALLFSGKIPVNLNYTAGENAVDSAISRCNIKTIISSRIFLEKLGSKADPRMVFIEDLLAQIPKQAKLFYLLASAILSRSKLEFFFLKKQRQNDLATIIFSSGSTGTPKGVMLSHANICSNIESLYEVFQLQKSDKILGVLPFFHSFGLTGTLWLPLISGASVVYHANPLDAALVGELVEKHKISLLMSTPTFLLSYIKKCSKEQFASLRYLVVGAEKLKPSIAEAFENKFGLTPLEGYGCTELSPVALLNVPNYQDELMTQVGHKPGTAGHPIPGVAVKIVDPETLSLLPQDTDGLLMVKGANVMLGYFQDEEKTKQVIVDGWYNTGDIARKDEDGFITITDRLSRFSKIAGEMVPHLAIEEAIQEVIGGSEQVCVVTSVADEKRGERLVVLMTKDLNPSDVRKGLSEKGLPNLWIPKEDSFYTIEGLPLLGSGKLDLKRIKEIAESKKDHENH